MAPRDPEERHRASTPLELFFDLTFAVAISEAASGLHHGLVDGHVRDVVLGFPLVFFAIWWAWMNFTWFASAYDTDDAVYRLAVLVQMTGVLILAAGVPRALATQNYAVVTAGYVVMRLALVAQWLRAAAAHPEGRACARRYAMGISVVQVGWVLRLALPATPGLVAFLALVAAELVVPIWAEAAGRTAWHPGHIAERFGLFTIIVLGESVLAATVGVQTALDEKTSIGSLMTVVVGGLLIVFAMWWMYFDMPAEQIVEEVRSGFSERLTGAFAWGYGHYFVFGGATVVGAGLAIAVDQVTGHSRLSDLGAAFVVTVPAAIYLVSVRALHVGAKAPGPLGALAVPVTVVLVIAASFTTQPVLCTGLLLAALVAVEFAANRERTVRPAGRR